MDSTIECVSDILFSAFEICWTCFVAYSEVMYWPELLRRDTVRGVFWETLTEIVFYVSFLENCFWVVVCGGRCDLIWRAVRLRIHYIFLRWPMDVTTPRLQSATKMWHFTSTEIVISIFFDALKDLAQRFLQKDEPNDEVTEPKSIDSSGTENESESINDDNDDDESSSSVSVAEPPPEPQQPNDANFDVSTFDAAYLLENSPNIIVAVDYVEDYAEMFPLNHLPQLISDQVPVHVIPSWDALPPYAMEIVSADAAAAG